MKVSFLLLLAIFLLSTSAFRERIRKQNKPNTQKEQNLAAKSKALQDLENELEARVDKCRDDDDKACYKAALKALADFKRRQADHFKQLKKLLEEVDSESKSKVDKTEDDDDKNLKALEDSSKSADDLDKESDDVDKNDAEAEEQSKKQEAVEKKVEQVNKQGLILAHMTDAEKATSIISACTKAATNATPPEFCWKKGADVGKIPTGCPSGWERKLALCFQKCPSGYFHRAGMCHQRCPSGYSDTGLTCHRWWWPHTKGKHMYFPSSMTNFDSRIPCPSGMYKSAALCYRDCGKIGMVNCGIGACARDSGSCASNIINMVVSVIEGIIQAIGLVVSLGSSSGLTSGFKALSSAAKNVGKATLKGMMRGVKGWWKRISKDSLTKIMKEAVKDKIMGNVTDAAINSMINTYCSHVATAFKDKISGSDSDFNFTKMDVTGISNAVSSCDGSNGVQCARAITEMAALVDPTGIATIAAAFMHSKCEGV